MVRTGKEYKGLCDPDPERQTLQLKTTEVWDRLA